MPYQSPQNGKRFSNITIKVTNPNYVASIDFIKNRYAILHPNDPALTDEQAIEIIIAKFAIIAPTIND